MLREKKMLDSGYTNISRLRFSPPEHTLSLSIFVSDLTTKERRLLFDILFVRDRIESDKIV